MAESKKMLVAFDPEKPDKASSDFLVPVLGESGEIELIGTRSKKSSRYGIVILTGRAVTENDLFAKLVDTGRKISNVVETLDMLGKFLEAMKTVRIGNIVEVAGRPENSIIFVVASKTPSGFGK